MLKISVGYENLHSTSPSHDKQTLKISWKSAYLFFQGKSSKNAIKYGMVSLSRSLSRRMTTIL